MPSLRLNAPGHAPTVYNLYKKITSIGSGPDNDVVLWDVCTKEAFRGRVLYRDVVENNLPGMLWWQGRF